MQEFLLEWAKKHGCSAKKDGKGNILMVKGKPPAGQFYPAFVNHVDTVHHDQEEMVKQHVYKEIVWEGDKVTAINPLLPKNRGYSAGRYGSMRWTSPWAKDEKDGRSAKQSGKDDVDVDVVDVELGDDGAYSAKDAKPGKKPDRKDKKEKPEDKKEEPEEMGRQTGLGMDNQGGCVIALAVIDSLPFAKAVFTVEEEIGMLGAKALDMSFFDDCAFVFSNDSPDRNRGTHYSSGVQLYSDEFFKEHLQKICAAHGLTDFRSEPFTCILNVRNHALPDGKHLECLNFGNGGYDAHMDTEYARFSDVCAAEDLLRALCTGIPLDRQYSSEIKDEPRTWGGYGGYYGGGYGGYYGGGYGGYYGGRSYGGGGHGSWRSARDDDDWWATINGRKPAAGGKDFADRSSWETGTFTFRFKKPDFAATAALALRRLQRTTGEDKLDFDRDGDMIVASGTLLSLRYAYMACFNAENQAKYASWDEFLKKVPGARDAFEKAVEFDEDGGDDDSKMAHGGQDPCSITLVMDEEEEEEFREMLGAELRDADADVDSGGHGVFDVRGALDEVKKIWAGAVSIEKKTEFREFKDLPAQDQEEFWDEVEFDDEADDDADDAPSPAPDGTIEIDGLDDDGPPESEAEDFWKWWNTEGGGREG